MSTSDISSLAEAAGISVNWTDAFGKSHTVTPDSLRAILHAIDLPCSTDAQCADSWAHLATEQDDRTLPPLMTADIGKSIKLPSKYALHGKRYRIALEDGSHVENRFPSDPSLSLEIAPIGIYGYHRLSIDNTEIVLAVAPDRCFSIRDAVKAFLGESDSAQQKLWGLSVQLYGLRRQGDCGIGDFTSLQILAQKAALHGASAIAISPVHAMFSADKTRFSPYGPSSRLFFNAMHIDPAAVLGKEALAQALSQTDFAGSCGKFEQLDLIDWPMAAELRLSLLHQLFRQFQHAPVGEQAAFAEFRRNGGEALEEHARFEALHAHFSAANQEGVSGYWRTWPAAYRDPHNSFVSEFAKEFADEVSFHAFLQWQAARGLSTAQKTARAAGMPIGLITDLAIGAENDGSQAWSRQLDMLNGLSIGAPPDQLSAQGQNWGLSAFAPRALKARGFSAYIEMLRAAFAYAGGIRIDHVLGLARLWLVPDGAQATQGAYLAYPIDDLLRLIALESWRHKAIVIGEDLGTVPAGFDKKLARAGLLGIRVLLFQRQKARFLLPPEWSPNAIATTTTHDTPTLAGWWEGRDINWRTTLNLLEEGNTEAAEQERRAAGRAELWQAFTVARCARGEEPPPIAEQAPLDNATAFLGATPAPLAILPIEDALSLPEQPNLPGTVDSHPNWRRRLPYAVDQVLDEPAVAARLKILQTSRQTS
jgi:4-alpha-glucanotransferase